ncbi:DUF6667 domain-containing protein [Changpingibacter yushuensis]|uniref:DUF6667 domain-containing protein n=1 Tax=Changpingibacter yushuensis TaxID=2758440 RepID=UPI0015F5CC0F|nr:DUF6667 domain-containing protein [Changpingibacter yushuensis]
MEFQGYAFAAVIALLLAYVIPYIYRRRAVLAEARIDERYAEELRLLQVSGSNDPQCFAHGDEPHGTLFFRQPEVMMSKSEKAAIVDVRALAKDRARRRARIAKRAANQKRGYLAAGIVTALAAVAWILAFVASFPIAVAAVATGAAGVALIGLSYVRTEISKADSADRRIIEQIDKKLAANKSSAPRRSRESASEPVVSAESGNAAASSEPKLADHQDKVEKETTKAQRSGISMSIEAGFVTDQVVGDSDTSVNAEETPTAKATGVKRVESTASEATRKAPEVGRTVATESAEAASPARAAKATAPSYTLKNRTIEKRTVAPYQAPEVAEASVPYRPKNVGERLDDSEEVKKNHKGTDGLAGGSILDQLLDRRRA